LVTAQRGRMSSSAGLAWAATLSVSLVSQAEATAVRFAVTVEGMFFMDQALRNSQVQQVQGPSAPIVVERCSCDRVRAATELEIYLFLQALVERGNPQA